MSNNLPCISLPPALQGQLEALAASFGLDEEHAIERCFELTAQLIAIKLKRGGGEVFAVIDGKHTPSVSACLKACCDYLLTCAYRTRTLGDIDDPVLQMCLPAVFVPWSR